MVGGRNRDRLRGDALAVPADGVAEYLYLDRPRLEPHVVDRDPTEVVGGSGDRRSREKRPAAEEQQAHHDAGHDPPRGRASRPHQPSCSPTIRFACSMNSRSDGDGRDGREENVPSDQDFRSNFTPMSPMSGAAVANRYLPAGNPGQVSKYLW